MFIMVVSVFEDWDSFQDSLHQICNCCLKDDPRPLAVQKEGEEDDDSKELRVVKENLIGVLRYLKGRRRDDRIVRY